MERAHLKKPTVMAIWEALRKAKLVEEQGEYPRTGEQAAEKILALHDIKK